jgi:hypothetical protein
MMRSLVQAARAALAPKTPRNNRPTLAVEEMESRDLMSNSALLSLAQTAIQAPALSAIYYFHPYPTAAGQTLINGLWDSQTRATALADYNRDGQITRNDMIDIIKAASNQYTFVTPAGFHDLLTLVNNAGTVAMPGYVQNLANKAVVDTPAYSFYVGGLMSYSSWNPAFTAYESLGGYFLGQGVSNYFLGQVRPNANVNLGNNNLVTATYQQVNNVPLFANGGPVYQDVAQGQVGDCWLLASLAEVADRDPGIIRNMFIDNGDSTYTVRFFNNGVADYVTVDNYLPNGGNTYDHPQGDLWVALAEKAYAQECAFNWIGTNSHGTDGYQALHNGDPDWALAAITGQTSNYTKITTQILWPTLNVVTNASNIGSAWNAGQLVVLCTPGNPSSANVVPGHCYALVGYSNGQYTLFNPWGVNGGWNQKYYPGYFTGNALALAANFNGWAQAASAQGVTDVRNSAFAGLAQTGTGPTAATPPQTQDKAMPNALDLSAWKNGGSDPRSQVNAITVAAISPMRHQPTGGPTTPVDAAFAGAFADVD